MSEAQIALPAVGTEYILSVGQQTSRRNAKGMGEFRGKRRIRAVACTSLIALLLCPVTLLAWGQIGHHVSTMLAESRLTPAARSAIRSLLNQGESLTNVAAWADEQHDVPRSGPWHYLNVPLLEPRYDPKFCQPGGCVVSKVGDFKRVLLDLNARREEKQRALKFLIHFLEDLHQPLHVGDTGSRGGNLVQVRFFDLGSNLHRVWDSQIIEWHSQDEATWLQELDAAATPTMVAAWSKGNAEDWANESLAEARLAYRLPGTDTLMESGTKLGEEYCRFALPIIQRRLAQAGIRTAFVLNGIFR